eukprot:GHRQ01001977.1.p1 GENE.GHRQ01001977.1~~GHRQ01001977.1.p1  ORF type:complete len:312 (+),score=59.19 GHRQ01001977.1:272-1207(+)
MPAGVPKHNATPDQSRPRSGVWAGLLGEAQGPGGMQSLLSAGLAEFFCTAAFLFIATGTVTSGCHTADTARQSGAATSELETVQPGACFLGSTNLLNISLAFGLAIFVLVYASASFSGGHLNPAITIAMLLTRRIAFLRAVIYVICQLLGAIVGSALVRGVDPFGFRAALGAANRLNTWANVGTGLGVELILTAIFVFVVFVAVDRRRGADTAHLPVLAPLAVGIVVFLAHVVAIPIDGCSVNPARSFGTAVVSGTWQDHWIFWVGPIVGGSVAGLLYETLAHRAPIFGKPADKLHHAPDASPAGPLEYTV